jgi:hypothetical protein
MNFYSRSKKEGRAKKSSRRNLKEAFKDSTIEEMRNMRNIAMSCIPLRMIFCRSLHKMDCIESRYVIAMEMLKCDAGEAAI